MMDRGGSSFSARLFPAPRCLALVLALLLLVLAGPLDAKIYKWRDAQGKLHFSDSPDNVPAEVLNDDSKEYRPDSSRVNLVPSGTKPESADTAPASVEAKKDEISIPYVSREGSASRVIVNVTFNGTVTAPIMVDTGSPGLVITESLADRLGLYDKTGSSLMVLVAGIGGSQSAVRTIVDKLSLGGVSEKFIPAHIVRDMSDAYQGLIGMDILSGYRLTIDPSNKRLIANSFASAKDLPAGRDKIWWQSRYREFRFYNQFWEEQAQLISKSDSAYARMSTDKKARVERFVKLQHKEARHLYDRLERFARWNSVPRHWRN